MEKVQGKRRKNDKISALGNSQSTEAKNVLIIPHTCIHANSTDLDQAAPKIVIFTLFDLAAYKYHIYSNLIRVYTVCHCQLDVHPTGDQATRSNNILLWRLITDLCSTVILSLLLIQEGKFSDERMCIITG